MLRIELHAVDYIILCVYFLFVLGIGWALRRYVKTGEDFFMSGRLIPAWVAGLAFISANLGAQEVIGMSASGAKYGIMTSHFYWVGAIPAMVFLAIFMMPFYYGSRARSVPEYLKLRFDEKTRGFNAISFAVMTVFSSGISMYALSKLMVALLKWPDAVPVGARFHLCLLLSAVIVLLYIYMGGLTSAIYNEVLQFFLIVLGFLPLVMLGMKDVGGWRALTDLLTKVATNPANPAGRALDSGAWNHSWAFTGSASANPMGVEWFGVVFGLGFVLSFGYWCTDFLIIQRAMAADSMSAARRTPIIAAVPKMLFPLLVILPGMIAIALQFKGGGGFIPFKDGQAANGLDYDMAMPAMIARYLPSGVLGLSMTALMASFMSGMAGNVTAFNTVWTYDIYQTIRRWLARPWPHTVTYPGGRQEEVIITRREPGDKHYLWMGHMTTVVGILLSVACAYAATKFNNILDFLQLVFAFVNAPLFATFMLGMFWRRSTGHGAFFGLLSGTIAAAIHHGLTLPAGAVAGIHGGWLGTITHQYPSDMAQNFWTAVYAWTVCFLATIVISLVTARNKTDEELKGLVYSLTPKIKDHDVPWHKQPATLGIIVLVAAIILNIIFW